ncbi:hypothetical protein [Aurantiacibacter poecillastricola]|uniref:hypothetical protein n=1 Tax=Aurantiacibacter poecillastricola TaxID=3064385 RepID=UPI00273E6163|nr:hypothetical protein [Aurantiacibacter sp. 219JJ12-13]MDP5263497.1 hypothetical protein [Aurantiacibacter sp. 219JJ12-13]
MKIPSWFLGALALTPLAGALVGQQISAEPVRKTTDLAAALPNRPAIALDNASPTTRDRLPDHYALETPEGTIEVHELARRGRNAGYYEQYSTYVPDYEEDLGLLEGRWSDDELDRRAERSLEPQPAAETSTTATGEIEATHESPRIAHFDAMQTARTGEAATAQVTPVDVTTPQVTQARVIDVRSELASQQ